VFAIKKRALLTALVITIILVLNPSLLTAVKKISYEVICYPARVIHNVAGAFTTTGRCLRENKALKEQLNRLSLEISRMNSIQVENNRLREILFFKKHTQFKTISAEVISRVPSAWSEEILIINKGEKHRIKRRMAVCTARGLIGTVIETGPITSKVMLITDPESRIGVILQDSRQSGVLEGNDDATCKMIYLPMDIDLKFGEKIVTAGVGGIVPGGIPVGTVHKIGRSLVGLYKYALVKPYQDLNTVEEVLCIE